MPRHRVQNLLLATEHSVSQAVAGIFRTGVLLDMSGAVDRGSAYFYADWAQHQTHDQLMMALEHACSGT